MVIGATNDPAACSKKDEGPFVKFWERTIHCPLPHYGAASGKRAWRASAVSAENWPRSSGLTGLSPPTGDRLVLWPSLAARFGGTFSHNVSVSTLAHISDAQSTANIAQIIRRLFTPRRIEVMDGRPVTMDELMARLSQFKITPPEVFAALQTWEKLLPGYKCAPGTLSKNCASPCQWRPGCDQAPSDDGKLMRVLLVVSAFPVQTKIRGRGGRRRGR